MSTVDQPTNQPTEAEHVNKMLTAHKVMVRTENMTRDKVLEYLVDRTGKDITTTIVDGYYRLVVNGKPISRLLTAGEVALALDVIAGWVEADLESDIG